MKIIKAIKLISSISCLAVAFVLPGHAVVVTYDFNSDTPGSSPSGWSVTNAGGTTSLNVTADSGNLFGEGTSNQYVNFSDNSSSNSVELGQHSLSGFNTPVVRLGFDFYEATSAFNDGLVIQIGTDNLSANNERLVQIGLDDGRLYVDGPPPGGGTINGSAYTLDTLHSIQIIANNDSTSSNYDFGGGINGTLAAGTFDIWIDSTLLGDDNQWTPGGSAANRISAGSALDSFEFAGFSGTTQEILIDNIEFETVPEPSTYALILSALGILTLLRKKKE